MKKLLFTLSILCCLGFYSNATPPTYVVEDGITYTRVITHDEFISIGGFIIGESTGSSAGFQASVRTLSCDNSEGNCTGVTMTTDGLGNITAITIPTQCDPSGACLTSPVYGKFAYYNSQTHRIIFR